MNTPKDSSRSPFPPRLQTKSDGHGRKEIRELVLAEADGARLGLAGAERVFRIRLHVDYYRRGKIYKTTDELRYGVTTLTEAESSDAEFQALVRGYWRIETSQHHRRDVTQREDNCSVRHSTGARNLSLLRSLAIFQYVHSRPKRSECRSLARRQQQIMRQPDAYLRQLGL